MVAITGETVKLGFTFLPEASVLREEVVRSMQLRNRAAATTVGALSGVVGAAPRLAKQGSQPPDG